MGSRVPRSSSKFTFYFKSTKSKLEINKMTKMNQNLQNTYWRLKTTIIKLININKPQTEEKDLPFVLMRNHDNQVLFSQPGEAEMTPDL